MVGVGRQSPGSGGGYRGPVTDADDLLRRYARLVVRVGANVQPGQTLSVNAQLEHAPLARAIAGEGYAAGARYVDVVYADQHVRRSHIASGPDDGLGWSPPWLVKRLNDLADEQGALIAITGDAEPELLADLDGERVARARPRELAEAGLRISDGACNWAVIAGPNAGWARTVFGEPDVDRLWAAVATAVRLDEPDPVEAWREHIAQLGTRASVLNTHRFDAIAYRGPGTELRVGLHGEGRWQSALESSNGIEHIANMPTEEVFTTPDARRVDGVVRATLPLHIDGTIVRDLEVRFEGGRVIDLHASSGESVIRGHVATDDGAARLGELALVDGSSRVRQTGLVFYDTLFDENAASHIAFGAAILQCVPELAELPVEERHARGVNHSSVHTDFMVGADAVEIDGVTADGAAVPLLRGGAWVL